MKSLVVVFTILISNMSWAGGPDIPWPGITYGNNGNDEGLEPHDANKGDPNGTQYSYSIYFERNLDTNAEDCPFFIILEEVDTTTGQVVAQHETLHCTASILPAKIPKGF
jgi:hypothetical protein